MEVKARYMVKTMEILTNKFSLFSDRYVLLIRKKTAIYPKKEIIPNKRSALGEGFFVIQPSMLKKIKTIKRIFIHLSLISISRTLF